MSSNTDLNPVYKQMKNESFYDVETQTTIEDILLEEKADEPPSKENSDLKEINAPKSILKKDDDDSKAVIMIAKICFSIIFLAISSPIIIADLYYGFTDSSCVNVEPKNLALSMKTYLLVSGFVSIGSTIILIYSSLKDNLSKNNILCGVCVLYIIGLFHIIWNILGGIAFWGTIYDQNICDKNVSTYIFVSLIIKIVFNFLALNQKNEKKE